MFFLTTFCTFLKAVARTILVPDLLVDVETMKARGHAHDLVLDLAAVLRLLAVGAN